MKPQNITREFIRNLRGKYKGKGLMKALLEEKEFEKDTKNKTPRF
jgi:hypothetical protein